MVKYHYRTVGVVYPTVDLRSDIFLKFLEFRKVFFSGNLSAAAGVCLYELLSRFRAGQSEAEHAVSPDRWTGTAALITFLEGCLSLGY